MEFVVIDAIPALLGGDGRDPAVPDGAIAVLEHIAMRYRLAAIADAGHTATGLRRALEVHELDRYFESVGTSAGFGPQVTPRILRRMLSTVRLSLDQVVVVTGRRHLAEQLRRHRFSVILTEGPAGFNGVPDAIEAIETGRITP
jgi:hypothetical protein